MHPFSWTEDTWLLVVLCEKPTLFLVIGTGSRKFGGLTGCAFCGFVAVIRGCFYLAVPAGNSSEDTLYVLTLTAWGGGAGFLSP